MVELMVDETPYIIGYWISVNRAMKKNVQGLTSDPAEFLDLTTTYLSADARLADRHQRHRA